MKKLIVFGVIALAASAAFGQVQVQLQGRTSPKPLIMDRSITEPAMEMQNSLHGNQRVFAVMADTWRMSCRNTTTTCTNLVKVVEKAITRAPKDGEVSKVSLTFETVQVVSGEYWQIEVTGQAMRDRIEKDLVKAGFIFRPKPK